MRQFSINYVYQYEGDERKDSNVTIRAKDKDTAIEKLREYTTMDKDGLQIVKIGAICDLGKV